MQHKKFTKETEAQIIFKYFTEKKTAAQIAQELNIGPASIRRVLLRNNFKMRTLSEALNKHIKTETQEQEILKLYCEENKSTKTIANILNYSLNEVRAVLLKHNVMRHVKHENKIITIEDKLKAIELNKNNIAVTDIAKQLGYSRFVIRHTLKENGLKPNGLISDQKTKVSNKFSFLDFTLEKCFVLGLIYGDGHVDNNHFTIYSSTHDIDCLQKVNALFGNVHSIKKDIRSRNAISITINKKKLCDELRDNFGLVSNKSDKLIFPNIPEEMYSAFISGFIAADGSVSYYEKINSLRLSIYSCSKIFLDRIGDIIAQNTKIVSNKYSKNPNANGISKKEIFIISARDNNALLACNYIFKNSTEMTRGNRKYSNYIKYKIWVDETSEQIKNLHKKGYNIKEIKMITKRQEGIISNVINGHEYGGKKLIL